MEEFLRDLMRLVRYGSGLQQLMSELEQAAPDSSEGSDTSGMVRVTIAADGLPGRISVQPRWQDRLPAASLGAAVTEAGAAALQRRGEAWAGALERSGWLQRMGRLGAGEAAAVATDRVPAALRRPAGDVQPRPLAELYDEVMSVADAAMALSARARREPSAGAGSNAQRTVTVSLTPAGQVSCQADARWVSGRGGGELTAVLNAVLSAARADIAAASGGPAAVAVVGGHDRVMAEIFAALDGAARPRASLRELDDGKELSNGKR